MFSFGSKVKQKLSATRFEFSIVVHNLAPWPEGARAIAIGYQRGKRRRGATRSVYPSRQPGRLGAVVRINERFDMPVTLYKSNSGSSGSGGLGPFKKKCLILAVLETDGRTQATAALGRVVIDLSEYAAIEHQETRTFMVSCNKAIHAAVGDPQLMVTIRCRWKKLAREGPGAAASGLPDETASMSTDTTGSRMTANLSSFLRFKFTGKGMAPLNEEQDLRGFESAGGAGPHAGGGAGGRNTSTAGELPPGLPKLMDTIQESHDEPAEPVFAPLSTPGGSRSLTPQTSINKQLTPTSSAMGAMDPSPRSPHVSSRFGDGGGSGGPLEAGVMGMSLREAHATRNKYVAPSSPSPKRMDAVESAPLASNGSIGGVARRSGVDADRSLGSLRAAGSGISLAAASASDNDLLVALRFELLTAAALEAAVYLARRPHGAGLPPKSEASVAGTGANVARSVSAAGSLAAISTASRAEMTGAAGTRASHAPARRLVRTVLCLGPSDGPAFAASALRVVRAQVATAREGLEVLSYWWSNAVHMRAMLTGLSLAAATGMLSSASGAMGAASGGSCGEHWAAAALVGDLRRLERSIFEDMLSRMWGCVLLPSVLGNGAVAGLSGRPAAKDGPARASTAITRRAQQEAAIKKWFEGLEAVSSALARQVGGAGGHCGLLRQQVLLQCLKRVDLLFFVHLLGGVEQPGVAELLADYDPHGIMTGGMTGSPSSFPQLDDSSLPFARGVLTFGGGMSVKMTVTRLQQWATGQAALGAGGSLAGDAPASANGADRGSAAGSVGGAAAGTSSTGPLFPLLRAAADLLMMPKELLLDRAVRLDVGAALSMRSVLHILQRFQPDEFAQDCISPAILESLQDDAALPQIHLRSAAADLHSGYVPPPDSAALRGVEAGSEPGLEYDADSEDELEELAQVVAKSSAGAGVASITPPPAGGAFTATRFRLLHELWAAGMPRRRAAGSVASEQI
ncbi:hypothetical protein Agub_g5785 [Astrephomene gubernaculifera]|uniref:C2 NT-type domain-containing protein n=1 Tax=Astrephomene gubernaculifera TaxID=47775 RepID=A0AAD3DMV3_9CHLO|nr:hypothetical protein Agub_g5785 [Astrephomene gubernaculifera]